jgi:hypothetical protein
MLLMKQGEQAWLLAGSAGNHEFARMFFFDDGKGKGPHYRLREGSPRLGPSELVHVAVSATGCDLEWSCGRKSHIPPGWYQVTYRV